MVSIADPFFGLGHLTIEGFDAINRFCQNPDMVPQTLTLGIILLPNLEPSVPKTAQIEFMLISTMKSSKSSRSSRREWLAHITCNKDFDQLIQNLTYLDQMEGILEINNLRWVPSVSPESFTEPCPVYLHP